MYYLLLDEVQLLDCFESVLNGYLRKENMDVYVLTLNIYIFLLDMSILEGWNLKTDGNIKCMKNVIHILKKRNNKFCIFVLI